VLKNIILLATHNASEHPRPRIPPHFSPFSSALCDLRYAAIFYLLTFGTLTQPWD